MGREIRKVIPNWEHPKETKYNPWKRREETRYVPLYDWSYSQAIAEWILDHQRWENGKHPDQKQNGGYSTARYYAERGGDAPRVTAYRPDWKKDEMTWFQVYETVSEGTPVTPPFETRAELVDYLVANGDFWDQKARAEGDTIMPCAPWTRKQAEAFVKSEWAPSMAVVNGVVKTGIEMIAEIPPIQPPVSASPRTPTTPPSIP